MASQKVDEILRRFRTLFSLWVDPSKIDQLSIKPTIDERGILLEITGPRDVLAMIIGRKGSTINAVRRIGKVIGASLGASISIKVHTPRG